MAESLVAPLVSSSGFGAAKRDTILHALARAIEKYPDDPFATIDDDRLTYRQLDRKANALARSLATLGVAKGNTVVSLCENSSDVLIMWFAINKLGAIWVPINRAYRGEFLRHQVADADAKIAICDGEYLERFVEIADALPQLELILCRQPVSHPRCRFTILPFDDHRGADGAPMPIVVEPADLTCLIYTSGTTGPSKGCMISHNYMCSVGRQARRIMRQERHDTTWTPLPMFHIGALLFITAALVEGQHIAIARSFSLGTFWDDIEKSGATSAMLMASIFALVAHAPDTPAMKRCYGRLKRLSGVPISAEVRKIWHERFGVPWANSWGYGQTEGTNICMVTPDDDPPEDCAGRPAEEFEMMIVDANDEPVPDGTVGEIVYRPRAPNTMFEGYWRRPEATAAAWRNLWMHSGDLGRMEKGWLYFCDRAKDYLRARGENISSYEVERAYSAHPDIAEVAVHATGTQNADDEVKVTVVLRAGATMTEHDLCLWSIDRLPYFAVPRYYEFRTEIPKNPTGRIQKYKLREDGITATTWDRQSAGIVLRRGNS